jgi:hypothetical protein
MIAGTVMVAFHGYNGHNVMSFVAIMTARRKWSN